ncbi:MAG TPA: NAD(P)/FAD-dependent oxidoreductase [Burkholderiaceae bacterium]|nr:NAD(P)/FAD-dependent oxidoreductase [Burkholderiaceae bacterium]
MLREGDNTITSRRRFLVPSIRMEHFDLLIVGAGLSGIGAGCHMLERCPDRTFAILEGRDRSGGTWDLFRYPGIRSDSDMYTLGYAFRPWKEKQAIAHGGAILQYLRETAVTHGVDRRIRYEHKVAHASWSSRDARWVLEVVHGSERWQMSCNFLFLCCGYYRYDAAYTPAFEGIERFGGRVVHPQFWTDDIDWKGKRIVVIGSGATAMTLVPALASDAAHVTMVQRSPTWVVARPSEDPVARRLGAVLPRRWVHAIVRWKQVMLGIVFFRMCRRNPERAKKLLLAGTHAGLGPQIDLASHFLPRYNPWEQRLCLLPDGDLFREIRAGRISIATAEIDRFTETGLALRTGEHIAADLIVTATGLELQAFGGIALDVDGHPVVPSEKFNYKGVMFSDVPNFASCFGYSNASWTLKADLVCRYICRLLNYMRGHGFVQCTPHIGNTPPAALPWIDFSSGYFQRALDRFPKQGAESPWRLNQNYLRDLLALRFGRLNDRVMQFRTATQSHANA